MDHPVATPPSSDSGYDLTGHGDVLGPDSDAFLDDPLDPESIQTVETANSPALRFAAGTAGPLREPGLAMTATAPTLPGPAVSPTPASSSAPPSSGAPAPTPATGAAPVANEPAAAVSGDVEKEREKAKDKDKEKTGPRLVRKRKPEKRRWDAPAWLVSALIHGAILFTLGAMTISTEVARQMKSLDTALVSQPEGVEELVRVETDPSDSTSELVTGNPDAPSPGGGFDTAISSGPPSSTPVVGGSRVGPRVGAGTSLPQLKVARPISGLSMLPAVANLDLGVIRPGNGASGGQGGVKGGVVGVAEHGEALDQIAREILRHLENHKVIVAWMFDESESMRDDQRAIRDKFDRVTKELRENAPAVRNRNNKDGNGNANGKTKQSAVPPLSHVIVGFGAGLHYELSKPTEDIDLVGRAIDHLRVEPSGIENTFGAVKLVINNFARLINKERQLLIVLVTDESGDDGADIEEARTAALQHNVPVYVLGRQSMFGYPYTRIRYVDPITKDTYYPQIRRGPESAELELLQWDGLHDRWEEQPSGFAPYELARLTKETGGLYFLLPTAENARIFQREKGYSMTTMKEYVPDYESRLQYEQRRANSEFRKSLIEVIQLTKGFPYRRGFPIDSAELREAAEKEYPIVRERLNYLVQFEQRLRALQKLRNREPEKRWQAHYDLILAQIVTYQIKAIEYIACLEEMAFRPPAPRETPKPDRVVYWILEHSTQRKAPAIQTAKLYAEADRLLKLVIERHPNTPWADFAKDELRRGFSVQRLEESHSTQYENRLQFVPKY